MYPLRYSQYLMLILTRSLHRIVEERVFQQSGHSSVSKIMFNMLKLTGMNPILILWILVLLQSSLVSGDIRVLIRYREDSFIQEAIELSTDRRIAENITSRNILAITIRDSSVLELIRENVNVESIEQDHLMNSLIMGDFRKEDGQRDWEITPYGIEMVQADQLWEIPEAKEDLSVCVVDTGMDLGHAVRLERRQDSFIMFSWIISQSAVSRLSFISFILFLYSLGLAQKAFQRCDWNKHK